MLLFKLLRITEKLPVFPGGWGEDAGVQEDRDSCDHRGCCAGTHPHSGAAALSRSVSRLLFVGEDSGMDSMYIWLQPRSSGDHRE